MRPDEMEIAKRAYLIWELEGRPPGRDLDYWLRAETELTAAHAAEAAAPPVPVQAKAKPGRAKKAR